MTAITRSIYCFPATLFIASTYIHGNPDVAHPGCHSQTRRCQLRPCPTSISTLHSMPPVRGQTWHPQTNAALTSTLVSAMPGDTIVLNAGATYSGTFTLPMKNNPNGQWIYIVSSA